MASGCSVRRSVVPGCPFWPPGLRPDGSRKLVVRGGFFSPSLDGGLPLLELSNPSRRSSSATRASRLLMISSLAAISASSRAITSVGLTGVAGASSLCVTPAVSKAVSKVRVMDRLTHAADSESSFLSQPGTWAVTLDKSDAPINEFGLGHEMSIDYFHHQMHIEAKRL